MQAWQQVLVTNPDSQYTGCAGVVRRVEKDGKGDPAAVFVELDGVSEVQSFGPTELRIL